MHVDLLAFIYLVGWLVGWLGDGGHNYLHTFERPTVECKDRRFWAFDWLISGTLVFLNVHRPAAP